MKKRIFKDWVTYSLLIIQVLLICIITGEGNEDIGIELAVKVPMFMLLAINHNLIAKHTNFYTEGF